MGGCKARLFVQNFGEVLVVMIISAADAIFAKFNKKLLTRVKLPISRYMVRCVFQEALFLRSAVDSEGPRPGPDPGPGTKHGAHASVRAGRGMPHYLCHGIE